MRRALLLALLLALPAAAGTPWNAKWSVPTLDSYPGNPCQTDSGSTVTGVDHYKVYQLRSSATWAAVIDSLMRGRSPAWWPRVLAETAPIYRFSVTTNSAVLPDTTHGIRVTSVDPYGNESCFSNALWHW